MSKAKELVEKYKVDEKLTIPSKYQPKSITDKSWNKLKQSKFPKDAWYFNVTSLEEADKVLQSAGVVYDKRKKSPAGFGRDSFDAYEYFNTGSFVGLYNPPSGHVVAYNKRTE